ncbi:uncharacterized protein LOC104887394 [Beta vulgaris subsp. vulgaris]|uniref:uncharacterized protein LOC104887394 n=1 Tax=Beta vulgaris subsp. vulgaris TaxID=3555 RepID=UPI0025470142|nr:uncharacterized protein LOC104887394 [Beta vulgaris subsp. vulgaris]
MYENYTKWDLHGENVNESSNGIFSDMENRDEIHSDDSGVNMLEDAFGIPGMHLEGSNKNEDGNAYEPDEQPKGEAAKFFRLLKEYQEPLTTNGGKMTKLSYIVKLLYLKVLNNWSDSSFDSLLKLQSKAWGTTLPDSCYEARKLITDLGLTCVKIDACENDCILYWREIAQLDKCSTCNLPRTAKDSRWHKDERYEDEIMRHPADSRAWKSFDDEYGSFASDARNVRLGLACDGFQPFDNSQHSIWPVVLIPYNLPPWICMKPHSFILSLLIPRLTSPGRNIDVYLQPLIEELKELWEVGVETFDAYTKQNFNMRAMLLWIINDFPAYGDLSGWCTKGKFACPSCHKEARRTSLKHKGGYLDHRCWLPINHKWRKDGKSFNNKKEKRHAPLPLTGEEVLECYAQFEQKKFGKVAGQKRKWDDSNSLYGWRKKSIFFELPYWRKLLIRHNLDVMHIEKNVSDNILGTLMNIKGKTKDTIKARIDLLNMGIQEELHPILDGDKVQIPVASYTLSSNAKAAICDMFAAMKSPDGFLSNISRCVKDNGKKISCMKSHDHHMFIEQLLPLATRGFLPNNVYEPLVELSPFFRNLCSKNITMKELNALEAQIPYTLCKLEMIFPPAFFDVMVHLVIHLAAEAKIGGPVRYRWMYPIERYLRTLKKYIRNRAQPEGCIAEGYLADECLTFCSRYMNDIDTKFNRKGRNDDEEDDDDEGALKSMLDVFRPLGRPLGQGLPLHLSFEECEQVHLYLLLNCDELTDFVKEHKLKLEQENPRNVERRHRMQFAQWIYDRVRSLHEEGSIDEDLYNLVCFPSRVVRRYAGYIVNGFCFHTDDRCENRKTQNSGIMVRGDDVSDKEYYVVLKDVFEVFYPGGNRAFVFKCSWFDVQHHGRGYKVDDHGLIIVNKRFSLKTDEVYVLESQVQKLLISAKIVVFSLENKSDMIFQHGLYRERKMWVPAYMKHLFWAGMETTQRSESINSFFDGYVHKNTRLRDFVDNYCCATEARANSEREADANTSRYVRRKVSNFNLEAVFQRVCTDAKFKEGQNECLKILYVQ